MLACEACLARPVRGGPVNGTVGSNGNFPERAGFLAPDPPSRRHQRDRPGHPQRARRARADPGHPGLAGTSSGWPRRASSCPTRCGRMSTTPPRRTPTRRSRTPIFADGPLDAGHLWRPAILVAAAGGRAATSGAPPRWSRPTSPGTSPACWPSLTICAPASRGTIVSAVLGRGGPRRARPTSSTGRPRPGSMPFARGLADSLHGTGVRVVLVRPGFVTGRMTAGMSPAPLASTPEQVGAATAAALRSWQGVRLDPGPARRPGPGPAPDPAPRLAPGLPLTHARRGRF